LVYCAGVSVPSLNATRWSSVFRQLNSVANLDSTKLTELLRETNHVNLLLSVRDSAALNELIQILQPFAEATDITQGDQYTTIGSIIPTVVCLYGSLTDLTRTVRYNIPVVTALLDSLTCRFAGIFHNLHINTGSVSDDPKPYCHVYYLISPALDPNYGFIWLEEDLPVADEVKASIREFIIGECYYLYDTIILLVVLMRLPSILVAETQYSNI